MGAKTPPFDQLPVLGFHLIAHSIQDRHYPQSSYKVVVGPDLQDVNSPVATVSGWTWFSEPGVDPEYRASFNVPIPMSFLDHRTSKKFQLDANVVFGYSKKKSFSKAALPVIVTVEILTKEKNMDGTPPLDKRPVDLTKRRSPRGDTETPSQTSSVTPRHVVC